MTSITLSLYGNHRGPRRSFGISGVAQHYVSRVEVGERARACRFFTDAKHEETDLALASSGEVVHGDLIGRTNSLRC
jgi:hypothetical protein